MQVVFKAGLTVKWSSGVVLILGWYSRIPLYIYVCTVITEEDPTPTPTPPPVPWLQTTMMFGKLMVSAWHSRKIIISFQYLALTVNMCEYTAWAASGVTHITTMRLGLAQPCSVKADVCMPRVLLVTQERPVTPDSVTTPYNVTSTDNVTPNLPIM